MNFVNFLFALAELQRKNRKAVGIVEMCSAYGIKRGTANMYLKQLIKSNYIVRVRHGKYQIASNENTRGLGLLLVTPMDVYLESSKKLEGLQ